jgi:hypothetical protein
VNERDMYKVMMWAGAVLAILSAATTIVLLALAFSEGWSLLIPAILLGLIGVGSGGVAAHFGQRVSGQRKVFSNEIEQEVLNRKQRRDLKVARGDLVMQRALIEIQNEQDNIVHRQIEAANDPAKPPHKTRFGDDDPYVEELPRTSRSRGRDWER